MNRRKVILALICALVCGAIANNTMSIIRIRLRRPRQDYEQSKLIDDDLIDLRKTIIL